MLNLVSMKDIAMIAGFAAGNVSILSLFCKYDPPATHNR